VVPQISWTQPEVDDALEAAVERTGVPRVIVDDHGSDLHGGVALFQERHTATVEIDDLKHKAACLLKGRLAKDERWQAFQTQVGQARCAIHQTELGCLVPPAAKAKARFRNLQPQLEWAEGVLGLLQTIPAAIQEWVTPERVQAKLGWLQDFAEAVAEWSEWQQVVNLAVAFVARHGVYRGIGAELRQAWPRQFRHDSSATLAKDLVHFAATQARRAKPAERLPGRTEVLESCFGRWKQLEKQQARGGCTSLLVAFGALLAEVTPEVVRTAMQQNNSQDVGEWCEEHLGTTLFSKRKIAFAKGATKDG
jgi:hypothetical protein